MAVINDYVYTQIKKDRANPLYSGRLETAIIMGSFAVAAADDDGSVYRLDRLPADAIITKAEICNPAITGATSYDLGFYEVKNLVTGTGAAVDKDVLMAAVDISAGKTRVAPQNGLSAVAIGDLGKRIYELLGKTRANMSAEYDLAITANTVGSAAGTIEYRIEYAYPV
jgi:hypothetical protein